MENQELSFGEKAVGLEFNPSGNPEVVDCKKAFARIINDLNQLKDISANPEVKRMYSIAITEAQTAQMWAVKALTWKY